MAALKPGLRREAGGRGANHLVHIHDHLHLLGLRVELDQVSIYSVLGAADVKLAVVTLDDREVPALLVRVFARDLVRLGHYPVGCENM